MIALTVLLCALFAVSFGNKCDEGWRYSPYSGKCYRFYEQDSSWALGEFKCFFNGGHLISLHSYMDNQFAREMARGSKTLWLGNAQFGQSVNYVWTDHSVYDYESWPRGIRPPRISGRQCTKMNVETGEWFQSCCKVPSPYICMKDARQESYYDSYYNKPNDDDQRLQRPSDDTDERDRKASEFRQRYFFL